MSTQQNMTRFERARILGARALQIALGAPILVEVTALDTIDPVPIATRELEGAGLPMTVHRPREAEPPGPESFA